MSRPPKIHKPLGVSFNDALERIAAISHPSKGKGIKYMRIKLTYGELKMLLRQDPKTAGGGGFQNYLVQLGYRVDDDSGELELDDQDLEKINRYATKYGDGGFETRIFKIFGRTLGAHFDWPEKYKNYLK